MSLTRAWGDLGEWVIMDVMVRNVTKANDVKSKFNVLVKRSMIVEKGKRAKNWNWSR